MLLVGGTLTMRLTRKNIALLSLGGVSVVAALPLVTVLTNCANSGVVKVNYATVHNLEQKDISIQKSEDAFSE
jgi:hypothetical protein